MVSEIFSSTVSENEDDSDEIIYSVKEEVSLVGNSIMIQQALYQKNQSLQLMFPDF